MRGLCPGATHVPCTYIYLEPFGCDGLNDIFLNTKKDFEDCGGGRMSVGRRWMRAPQHSWEEKLLVRDRETVMEVILDLNSTKLFQSRNSFPQHKVNARKAVPRNFLDVLHRLLSPAEE